jgi:hypothetical protein
VPPFAILSLIVKLCFPAGSEYPYIGENSDEAGAGRYRASFDRLLRGEWASPRGRELTVGRRVKATLIHHPTIALHVSGFRDEAFGAFHDTGVYLGNVYRRIMPPSLPRLAALLEKHDLADVDILDLRLAGWDRDEVGRVLDWDGYQLSTRRIGAPFSLADAAIASSDWIGLSSHFTFESGVVRDLIAHAKRVNPRVKVMVGGADVMARPQDYLRFGADLAFVGDFDPQALTLKRPGPSVVGPHRHPFAELIAPDFTKLRQLAEYRDSHDGPVPDGVPHPIGFIYFTRGCPRECDFCESRRTTFEALDPERCYDMLGHYARAGIRTLNLADDNLLLAAARPEGRANLLQLLRVMRQMGFAWEYPNGLEIGRLVDRTGALDEELMEALFQHERDADGNVVGAYRVYIPVETFERRSEYSKLRPVAVQNRVIEWLSRSGLPEIDFGVVLSPDSDEETFENTRQGYLELREIMTRGGDTRARYAVFHLIPIALFRGIPTRYSVDEFPEGWNFYCPVYDGKHFTARELFERRLRLVKEVDPNNYLAMTRGEYGYY